MQRNQSYRFLPDEVPILHQLAPCHTYPQSLQHLRGIKTTLYSFNATELILATPSHTTSVVVVCWRMFCFKVKNIRVI